MLRGVCARVLKHRVKVLLVLVDRGEVRAVDELDDAFPPPVPDRLTSRRFVRLLLDHHPVRGGRWIKQTRTISRLERGEQRA